MINPWFTGGIRIEKASHSIDDWGYNTECFSLKLYIIFSGVWEDCTKRPPNVLNPWSREPLIHDDTSDESWFHSIIRLYDQNQSIRTSIHVLYRNQCNWNVLGKYPTIILNCKNHYCPCLHRFSSWSIISFACVDESFTMGLCIVRLRLSSQTVRSRILFFVVSAKCN